MKKYCFALLAVMLVLAGCDKSSVDNRDAFVGTYNYETQGEMTLSGAVPGLDPTLPLDTEGTFKIEKLSNKDSVLISGAMGGKMSPFKAIVKGSQLEFVGNEFASKGTNFEVSMSISNPVATMAKDTLVWMDEHIGCAGKLYGFEITGEGSVMLVACKKK